MPYLAVFSFLCIDREVKAGAVSNIFQNHFEAILL